VVSSTQGADVRTEADGAFGKLPALEEVEREGGCHSAATAARWGPRFGKAALRGLPPKASPHRRPLWPRLAALKVQGQDP